MISLIRNWVLAVTFRKAFGEIEKQNLITLALAKCYTVPAIQAVWGRFCDSVISLLEDAIGEAKAAKKWK